MVDIESLAKELHEAGRAAVESGQTVAAGNFGEKARKFLEWDEISIEAQDGRRIQARYLLERYYIFNREDVNKVYSTFADQLSYNNCFGVKG